MSWLESLLIIVGISFDIFASMEVEGSMLARVRRSSLAIACFLVTLLQFVFFFGGYFAAYEAGKYGLVKEPQEIGYLVSVVVFALLGLRLLVKAIKKEFIHEKRREDILVRDYIKIIAVTSLYMIAAGCAHGFVGTSVVMLIADIIICSVLFVIAGIYTGYHFGIEPRTGFYIAGAVLLWIAGAEILCKSVIRII